MLRALWHEREQQKQRIEELSKRSDDLYLENLQLQKELLRYKKATYGPRADRLNENELAQALLEFAEELEQKPLPADRKSTRELQSLTNLVCRLLLEKKKIMGVVVSNSEALMYRYLNIMDALCKSAAN